MKTYHLVVLFISSLSVSCAEPGKSGEESVDCGPHGSPHDGHCHCHEGYLLNGDTCVGPEEITDQCAEEADAGAHTAGDEHHHEACRCPEDGECPCDGHLTTIGGADFCTPEIEHE